jgi:hypothetical protein
MTFSVSNFKSGAKNGFLSPAKHELVISSIPSRVLQNYSRYFSDGNSIVRDQIRFHCEAATLPGVALNTHQFRTYGYGVNETRPVHPVYQKLNLSLYADSDGKMWKFMNSWINLIVSHGSEEKNWGYTKPGAGMSAYDISYRDEYATIVELKQYDNNGKEKINIKMNYAFPMVLGDINVNWGLSSQIMRIPVVFSYMDWYDATERKSPSQGTTPPNQTGQGTTPPNQTGSGTTPR